MSLPDRSVTLFASEILVHNPILKNSLHNHPLQSLKRLILQPLAESMHHRRSGMKQNNVLVGVQILGISGHFHARRAASILD
ncbi:hypothetical protein J3458_019177 [Metarhizium acridum]|uniref:uncharacterized protein n=1 Tax=Metarhizium acridum TaxID=92637 RepID=UPI001C6C8AB8|nr:hypothetical protein J3458_019177 [Metarhizium acridum]